MYMNNYTGEVYDNLLHAIKTMISDMIRYPECRTSKMLSVSKLTA